MPEQVRHAQGQRTHKPNRPHPLADGNHGIQTGNSRGAHRGLKTDVLQSGGKIRLGFTRCHGKFERLDGPRGPHRPQPPAPAHRPGRKQSRQPRQRRQGDVPDSPLQPPSCRALKTHRSRSPHPARFPQAQVRKRQAPPVGCPDIKAGDQRFQPSLPQRQVIERHSPPGLTQFYSRTGEIALHAERTST